MSSDEFDLFCTYLYLSGNKCVKSKLSIFLVFLMLISCQKPVLTRFISVTLLAQVWTNQSHLTMSQPFFAWATSMIFNHFARNLSKSLKGSSPARCSTMTQFIPSAKCPHYLAPKSSNQSSLLACVTHRSYCHVFFISCASFQRTSYSDAILFFREWRWIYVFWGMKNCRRCEKLLSWLLC